MISIIIPVYNAEKYLDRAITSLLKQDLNNVEIIIIDDGSRDHSIDIVKKHAKENRNIHVYREENAGASAARNLAIEKSSGEYIIFMDSDDYVNFEMIEILKNEIKLNENIDMYVYGLNEVSEEGNIKKSRIPENMNVVTSGTDDILLELFSKHLLSVTWNKMISRKFLNKTRFKNILIGEDYQFYLELMLKQPRLKFIPHALYNYHVDVENSLMNRYDPQRLYVLLEQKKLIEKILTNAMVENEKSKRILKTVFFRNRSNLIINTINGINGAENVSLKEQINILKDGNKNFKVSIKEICHDKNLVKSRKIKLLLAYYPNWFTVMVLKCIYLIK